MGNPMKIAVFGPHDAAFTNAMTAGLEQLRHHVIQQNASAWTASQASAYEFEAVFLPGLRGNYGAVARYYSGHGIPVFSVDAPHLRTTGDQFRVERLFSNNRLPEFDGAQNEDRLAVHGIQVRTKARTKNNYILFCGQKRDDQSHGLGHGGYEDFVRGALATIRSLSDSEIYWRPHPSDVFPVAGFDGTQLPADVSLEESLAKAWLVATHSSGSGIEALVAGIPVVVFAHPVYEELAFTTQTWKDIVPPKPEAVKALLTRLAYTQWTYAEIASGLPLEHLLKGSPFPGALPEPVKEPGSGSPKLSEKPKAPENPAATPEAMPNLVAENPGLQHKETKLGAPPNLAEDKPAEPTAQLKKA